MSECVSFKIGDSYGILCLSRTEFLCPKCSCPHTEDDYMNRLDKSKRGFIYKQCKGCKTKLGIAADFKGDIHVWIKEEEHKQGIIKSIKP